MNAYPVPPIIVAVCVMSVLSWHSRAEADPPPKARPMVADLPDGSRPRFGLGHRLERVQWSHDSKRVFATSDFNKLTLWEQKESKWVPTFLDVSHHANSIAASRKSPLMVVGTNVGTAEVWDTATQQRACELRSSPRYSVYAVAISPNDNSIAACGTNGTVHVFDRESQLTIAVLGEKADTRMASLAFSPDGKTLAAMDRYGHLVLWSLPAGERLAEWTQLAGERCSVQWSPDGRQLAVSGWGKVTLIAAERGGQPRVVEAPEAVCPRTPKDESNGGLFFGGLEPGGIMFASVTAIAPDLRTVASVAPDASVAIWELATRKIVQKLPAPDKVAIMDSQSCGLRHLTFSPNGQRLACTTLRGEVVFWQLAQADEPNEQADEVNPAGTKSPAPAVKTADPKAEHQERIDAAKPILVWGEPKNGLRAAVSFEPSKATPAFVLPDYLNVMAVGFGRESNELVSVATKEAVTIRTWDVDGKKLKHEVEIPTEAHDGSFSYDGRWFGVGFTDEKKGLAVWQLRDVLEKKQLSVIGVGAVADDAQASAAFNEKISSGLVPGFYGGSEQTMGIDPDGSISYSDAKGLCQMTLFDDDRLKIAFQNDREIWTDVTLPLVTGAGRRRRAVWSAEIDGHAFQATAIPFSTRGCVFRLEKRLDGKLIHGSLQFYAVKSRQAGAEQAEPAAPINHREWRVDQSGTGVVAGRYTGASQPMRIADDGTVSYSDQPHGICHLAVLEDNRLTATFLDARGMPTDATLALVTTAVQHHASWSAEIDGHALRATAIPYSDTVYIFRLEKLRDGKLIEGLQQFYAIDQKLRKATPEEKAQAASDSNTEFLKQQLELLNIIARLKKQEEILKGCIVTAETKMKQRTGAAFDGPELQREFKTEFRFDDQGRIYSKQQGGVPGRIGTAEVMQQIEVGAFNGRHVTILRGRDEFDWAYRGPDKSRIPREVDPRDYLFWYWNEPLSQRLAKNYRIAGLDRWRDQDVIVIESEPNVNAEQKTSFQGRLLVAPALDFAVVVRTARIRFDDIGPEWHEFSRQETFDYERHEQTGLWFPNNGTYTSLNPTRARAAKKEAAPLAWQKETKFRLWKPNPEFTDADFTLEIPVGIFVMNEPIPPQPKEPPQPNEDSDAEAPNVEGDKDTRSDKQQERETDAQQEPADQASTERAPAPDEVFAGRVSLQARKMPLKQALDQLARQAGVELQLDVEALNAVELNVDDPVTASFQDEPLDVAIGRLIDWRDHPGAFLEFRAGRLVLTTIGARQRRVARHLPDRLKPLYTRGLLAKLDEDHQVESITASSIWTDDLLQYLATLPKLRELHIEVTKSITPAGLKHLGQLRNLENLSLYEVNQDGNGLGDESMRAIAGLQSLRELRVNNCGLTDAGARHLEGLPQLTRLELDEGRLTDTALASIGKLRQLKHLSLSSYVGTAQYGRMHFTATGLPSLAGLRELEELHLVGQDVAADLLSWPQLKSLSLGGSTVDDACAERIAACRELKSLSLVYTAVSDRGIQQIATLPLLRRLNLDSRVITDEAMNHLKAVKSLEMLTLRATRLTDESLRHVSEMKSLRRLDLHGSGQPGAVTGENFSISALRQLKALPKLHTLWLTNFRSPGGYLGLADLTQLRELSLMMADIRTEDLDALETALPNTTIHCASGGGFRRPTAKRGRKTAPNQ